MSVFVPDLLKGKVAYVAGGTRGMNLAIARRFAAYGARVAVMSRNPERCAAAKDAILRLTAARMLSLIERLPRPATRRVLQLSSCAPAQQWSPGTHSTSASASISRRCTR